jgi:hypothetical protein
MALIENEDYKIVSWVCPNCDLYYPEKKIITREPSWLYIDDITNRFFFCNDGTRGGCAQYFDINGNNVTHIVERNFL